MIEYNPLINTATLLVFGVLRNIVSPLITRDKVEIKDGKTYIYVKSYNKITDNELLIAEKIINIGIQKEIEIQQVTINGLSVMNYFDNSIYQDNMCPKDRMIIACIGKMSIETIDKPIFNNTNKIKKITNLKVESFYNKINTISFLVGEQIELHKDSDESICLEISKLLSCNVVDISSESKLLFKDWKKNKKIYGLLIFAEKNKKDKTKFNQLIVAAKKLKTKNITHKESQVTFNKLKSIRDITRTQNDGIISVLKRFKTENDIFKHTIQKHI